MVVSAVVRGIPIIFWFFCCMVMPACRSFSFNNKAEFLFRYLKSSLWKNIYYLGAPTISIDCDSVAQSRITHDPLQSAVPRVRIFDNHWTITEIFSILWFELTRTLTQRLNAMIPIICNTFHVLYTPIYYDINISPTVAHTFKMWQYEKILIQNLNTL